VFKCDVGVLLATVELWYAAHVVELLHRILARVCTLIHALPINTSIRLSPTNTALPCRFTPSHVLELLLDILASNDNSSNPLEDGHWLAGLVAALGQLRLRNTVELAKVCPCSV
jgi:hypothetical protein